ncbi:histidine kinase [uncultured Neptuniibacter sp.]|uniref:sensor histidine kinase n=1 Tax=uncultured Neptuniibacter sp. TaxID=502143 RepID=UPI00261A4775|nr:histidine kinase [uncultured Neptuniibacter sp.]
MGAVFRLNLLVALVFLVASLITLYAILLQASKDISREVTAGVSFTHRLMSAAANDEILLAQLVDGGSVRHVVLKMSDGNISPLSQKLLDAHKEPSDIPAWFTDLIPGLQKLEEKHYFRYLPDGRVLHLRGNIEDELEEVWESVQLVLLLFLLSAVISNLAISWGVKRGIKPVSDFVNALGAIKNGQYCARMESYSIREINELSGYFNAMAHSLEKAEGENRALTQELIRVQEAERAYLARELHDDLGQYLTGIRAQAYLVAASKDNPSLIGHVGEQISQHCDSMQTSFRKLIQNLHPVALERVSVLEAIRLLVSQWQTTHKIHVQLDLPMHLPELEDERKTHVYRILQEALTNIAKHAGATAVYLGVALDRSDNCTVLVKDDGQGMCSPAMSGLGIRSMKERAHFLHGALDIKTTESEGCSVKLSFPVCVKECV